jgi:hypothetical protein
MLIDDLYDLSLEAFRPGGGPYRSGFGGGFRMRWRIASAALHHGDVARLLGFFWSRVSSPRIADAAVDPQRSSASRR